MRVERRPESGEERRGGGGRGPREGPKVEIGGERKRERERERGGD